MAFTHIVGRQNQHCYTVNGENVSTKALQELGRFTIGSVPNTPV